ncbi:MAG: aldehyde dehydrogenase family protein, partial [Betaproteobacteria bacterium]
MANYKLLINGELVDGASTMEVINPATETVLALCPRADEAQMEAAIQAAKAAFPAWSRRPIAQRREMLLKLADAMDAQQNDLARVLTQEQGKPLGEATTEVLWTALFIRGIASQELPVKILEDNETMRVEQHRLPLGVVGAIIPWNFPLLLMAFKLPAALLAGNTIIIKPAPTTPLATLKIGEIMAGIFPAGVVNVVTD